jgi:hypothetical protein
VDGVGEELAGMEGRIGIDGVIGDEDGVAGVDAGVVGAEGDAPGAQGAMEGGLASAGEAGAQFVGIGGQERAKTGKGETEDGLELREEHAG